MLRQALESVVRQEFHDFEVIVVDDGSTDDLSMVIEEFQDRVTFFRQENAGPGAARNKGAAASCGEYLAFLDSDDLWFPWTLRVYYEVISETRCPTLLCGKILYFKEESDVASIASTPTKWDAYPDYLASSKDGLYCSSGQTVVRRDIFLSSGGFTDQQAVAEDHDFVMRIGTNLGYIQITEPPLVGVRQHTGSISANLIKTYQGIAYLISQERNGCYPGCENRRAERIRILCRHVRPVTLALLQQGHRLKAWELYRDTLWWNVVDCRIYYLAGFWAKAIISLL